MWGGGAGRIRGIKIWEGVPLSLPFPHPAQPPHFLRWGEGIFDPPNWGGGKEGARWGRAWPPPLPHPPQAPPPPSIAGTGAAAGPAEPPHEGRAPPSSTLSVGQARKMVEQLKIEASLCRVKVSKAAAELLSYCEAHACEDPLLTPVPTSENPCEKKFFCALL
ncbi:LOW QUALITY PROTEIN: guanine nucleotide-binding protein G(I)/G(S)/G(O) subunit gamma-3 [Cyanocitta cristata]